MVQNCIFDYMKRDLWLQLYGLTVKALKKISVLYCYYDWEMLIKRRYQAAPAERHWSLRVLLFLLIIQVFLICLRVPRPGPVTDSSDTDHKTFKIDTMAMLWSGDFLTRLLTKFTCQTPSKLIRLLMRHNSLPRITSRSHTHVYVFKLLYHIGS